MSNATSTDDSTEQLADGIVSKLHDSSKPLTVPALRDRLTPPHKLPRAELEQVLEDQVDAGRVFRFQPYGSKNPRYWDRDPEAYAKLLIQNCLNSHVAQEKLQRPLTISALWNRVGKELGSLNQREMAVVLNQLVEERVVYELPKPRGARSSRYDIQPPNPSEYLVPHVRQIREVAQRLERVDVPQEQTLKAAWELLVQEFGVADVEHAARMIQNRLGDIESPSGTGVTLRHLRDSLDFRWPYHIDFHETVRYLVDRGDVYLHDQGDLREDTRLSTQPTSESEHAEAVDLSQLVLKGLEELLRERFHQTSLVPVHELRRWIDKQVGPRLASHDQLDPTLRQLRAEQRIRLVPITNTSKATPGELEAAIPGVHETLFYVELSR